MKFRKILGILFLSASLLFAGTECYALSLSEVHDGSFPYHKIVSSPEEEEYVDTSSITVIRNDKPFYVIEANTCAVYYNTGMIVSGRTRYLMDYRRSTEELAESCNYDPDRILAAIKANSGISWKPLTISVWNFNGKQAGNQEIIDLSDTDLVTKAQYGSPAFQVANYVFEKALNMEFNWR